MRSIELYPPVVRKLPSIDLNSSIVARFLSTQIGQRTSSKHCCIVARDVGGVASSRIHCIKPAIVHGAVRNLSSITACATCLLDCRDGTVLTVQWYFKHTTTHCCDRVAKRSAVALKLDLHVNRSKICKNTILCIGKRREYLPKGPNVLSVCRKMFWHR